MQTLSEMAFNLMKLPEHINSCRYVKKESISIQLLLYSSSVRVSQKRTRCGTQIQKGKRKSRQQKGNKEYKNRQQTIEQCGTNQKYWENRGLWCVPLQVGISKSVFLTSSSEVFQCICSEKHGCSLQMGV